MPARLPPLPGGQARQLPQRAIAPGEVQAIQQRGEKRPAVDEGIGDVAFPVAGAVLICQIDDRLGHVFHGNAVDGREHAGQEREKKALDQIELAFTFALGLRKSTSLSRPAARTGRFLGRRRPRLGQPSLTPFFAQDLAKRALDHRHGHGFRQGRKPDGDGVGQREADVAD